MGSQPPVCNKDKITAGKIPFYLHIHVYGQFRVCKSILTPHRKFIQSPKLKIIISCVSFLWIWFQVYLMHLLIICRLDGVNKVFMFHYVVIIIMINTSTCICFCFNNKYSFIMCKLTCKITTTWLKNNVAYTRNIYVWLLKLFHMSGAWVNTQRYGPLLCRVCVLLENILFM